MYEGSFRWVLVVVLALAVIGLLAYARGNPGDDGRDPEGKAAGVLLLLRVEHRTDTTP